MKPITLFSFGYYGWGNATERLEQVVDAVERSRGFRRPIFVDCRIRRSVRAVGFNDAAFQKLLGPARHRWMPELGNQRIVSGSGPNIQIAEPAAASDLLDLAVASAEQQRRIIFFCGCQFAKIDGEPRCHRTAVASLLLQSARKRKVSVDVVEWPGGEPSTLDLDVEPHIFRAIERGVTAVPIATPVASARWGAVPWCSVATFHSEGNTIHRLVGPAAWRSHQWCLPVMFADDDPDAGLTDYLRRVPIARRSWGFEARLVR